MLWEHECLDWQSSQFINIVGKDDIAGSRTSREWAWFAASLASCARPAGHTSSFPITLRISVPFSRYSINTEGALLHSKLKTKAYLRITMGPGRGESPGIPYVLEIWPKGTRNLHCKRHCTENSKQIIPEMKLRGLVLFSAENRGPIVGKHTSLTDTWMWKLVTRPVSFISGNT